MKWLFLILMSINIVLFVTQYKSGSAYNTDFDYVKSLDVENLKLLRESELGEKEKCLVLPDERISNVRLELLNGLRGENVFVEELVNIKELAPSFWVFISEQTNSNDITKLKELGIESYLVGEGDFKGKRSVGLFANIDLARNMMKRLEINGFVADIAEKKRQKEVRWLSIKVKSLAEKEVVMGMAKDLNINVAEFKEIFCKSIASEK